MDERSDEELMALVCKQDRNALSTLIDRHIDPLYTYAHRLSGSSSLAEDLVQDTWLTTWEKARTFRPNKVRLTTWLHKVLYNKFIDTTRRVRREVELEPISSNELPLEDTVAADQRHQRLIQALKQLPDTQRAAIALTHLQGFSNKDVAAIIGQSVRATESLLARARNNLKEHLRND